MSASPAPASEKVLNSWKELALYLHRSVRTAQRWETELGLPVRRPRGKSRSAVIAVCSEIDAWLQACPLGAAERVALAESANVLSSRNTLVFEGNTKASTTVELIAHSRMLRQEVSRSRGELTVLVTSLIGTIRKMTAPEQMPGTLPPGNHRV